MGEAVLTNQEVLTAFVVKDIKANSVKKVRQNSSRCSKNMTTEREYSVAHPFLSFILV